MSTKREKVVVAMSGGVDSSVAACLLIEQGYDVIGLFMRVGVEEPKPSCPTETLAGKPPVAHNNQSPMMDGMPKPEARACDTNSNMHGPDFIGTALSHGTQVRGVPAPEISPPPLFRKNGAPTDKNHARASVGMAPNHSDTFPLPDPDENRDGSDNNNQSNPRGLKPAAQENSPLPDPDENRDGSDKTREHQGCCSASDAADARFVAGMLDVPFFALNFQADFDEIIDYFVDEYARGRTPNPCVVCNDKLKFGKLVDYADAVGAKYIATGHYARIERDDQGHHRLLRGVDHNKDQSYVLFGLEREVLDRVLFPVGELNKSEVRDIAKKYNLPNQAKPDSVEICFVPDRDYARVVRERRPDSFIQGEVVDQNGEVIGHHEGVPLYTIGQRRGLGIAAGKPIYVTELNVASNTVTVGEADALDCDSLIANKVNSLTDWPDEPFRATVKIRYLHKAAGATIYPVKDDETLADLDASGPVAPASEQHARASLGMAPTQSEPGAQAMGANFTASEVSPPPLLRKNGAPHSGDNARKIRVVFDEPQRAVTPGQAVVFYDGDVVLGGAWIVEAEKKITCLQ